MRRGILPPRYWYRKTLNGSGNVFWLGYENEPLLEMLHFNTSVFYRLLKLWECLFLKVLTSKGLECRRTEKLVVCCEIDRDGFQRKITRRVVRIL